MVLFLVKLQEKIQVDGVSIIILQLLGCTQTDCGPCTFNIFLLVKQQEAYDIFI